MEILILKEITVKSQIIRMNKEKEDLLTKILDGLDLLKQKDAELTNEDIVDKFTEQAERITELEDIVEELIAALDLAATMGDVACSDEEDTEEGAIKKVARATKPKIIKKNPKKRTRVTKK